MERIPDPRQTRTIYYFPVVHGMVEMGSLAADVKRVADNLIGASRRRETVAHIGQYWDLVEHTVRKLNLAWPGVRIYQDGLPICGKELEITSDLASKGSRNHRLVMELVGKGAVLMGTESPELLLEEYRLAVAATKSIDRESGPGSDRYVNSSRTILAKRDAFIAGRIASTLLSGETGVVFLGLLHRIDDKLPQDIHYICELQTGLATGGNYT